MMDKIKLKPCPFCGGTDINCNHFELWTDDWWDVGCPNCEMWARDESKDEAIAAWNRRVEK